MSETEFSKYLSLLGSLLRISKGQREEISQELRDYLEDRFEELIEAGYSDHEARSKALEELGDAAKIANLFQSVSHQHQRRWMMKYASVSTLGCFLLIVMFVSMWPDSSRIRPLSPTVAGGRSIQEKDPAETKKKVDTASLKRTNRNSSFLSDRKKFESMFILQDTFTTSEITEAKLQHLKLSGFPTSSVSLSQYVEGIRQKFDIRIVFSPAFTEELGLDPESIEASFQNGMRLFQSLTTVLNSIQAEDRLSFVVVDGTVQIGIASHTDLQTTHVLDFENLMNETGIDKKEIQEVYREIVIGSDKMTIGEHPVKWMGSKLILKHSGITQMKFVNLLLRLYPDFEKSKREMLLKKFHKDLG